MNFKNILDYPILYSIFQKIMGAENGWKKFITNYIQLQPEENILDIGCGPADILSYLPKNCNYWGFDIDERYIIKAKSKANNPSQIKCKYFDESDLRYLPLIDVALLCGVIHHVNDDEANRILALISTCLGSHGRLVTFDPCITNQQNPIAKFLINNDRGEFVRDKTSYEKLFNNHFSSVSVDVVNQKWIPYTHCFVICSNKI